MKLSQKLIDWTYFGTQSTRDEATRRHIIFSNVTFLTLPIVYFLFMLIDYETFSKVENLFRFDRMIVPVMILITGFCLFLNKIGATSISRILFLTAWLLLLHVIPIVVLNTPIDYYLAFPLGIIFHSVLIHFCFSARKEPMKFWPFLAANFIIMINARIILVSNDLSPESENLLRIDPYFILDTILYWLLFNILFYYLFRVIEYYVADINNARKLISKQREDLVQKNFELETAVYSLGLINRQMEDLNKNLESKVSERTHQLRLHSEKLLRFAFINAHQLRGPFCRIKGLIMLRNTISRPTGEEETINTMLMESLDELDGITTKLQRTVEELEPDDGKRQPQFPATDLTGSNREAGDQESPESPV